MKVLAIGDIHTKTWIIDKVVNHMNEYDAIVFVGDYADNWDAWPEDTIQTWDALAALSQHPKVHCVMGNHDYAYVHHLECSGHQTLTQLLIDAPENKETKQWLQELPVSVELDGGVYSHAGYVKGWDEVNHSLWAYNSPFWARPFLGYEYEPNQVFGHTPSSTCDEIQPNVWCIDTFSTFPNGEPIGDQTVLEIIDGKRFNKISLT